jgi:hypothetical protein
MQILKKTDPWKAVYKSWYSIDVYRDAAHCWRGLAYRYLLFTLFGLWLIASVHIQIIMHEFFVGYVKPIMQQLPKMDIEHGVMTIDRPDKVFQVISPRTGKAIISFDMSEKPPLPGLDEDGIFVEKKRVLFHLKGKEHAYDYAKMKDTSFEWKYYIQVVDFFGNWSGIFLLALFWMSSFIFCALQALLYALVGKVIAMFAKRRLTFPQLVRVSVVAMTPALIIDTFQKLLCAGIPAWPLVSVAITMVYLIFGVKVNSVSFEWSLTQGLPSVPAEKNSAA